MDLLGRLVVAFQVDLSDLDSAETRLRKLGGAFTDVGQIATVGLTLPIAAAGTAALAAAVQFETAMVSVAKTVDAPEEAIAELGETLKALSEATGTSVTELARIAEIGGQMGIAADDLSDFTEVIAALGVATELSTEAAAEGLAAFSNVMGTSIDEIDELGSALVALGNAGNSSEAQILEMAQRISAAGNQVGLAESEVLAFASALSDLGIDAEAGGTAISKLFFNIQSDVATGGGTLKEFARVAGLSVGEFSELFRDDAASAVLAFVEGLGAMDKRSGEAIVTLNNMGIEEVRLRNAVLSLAAGHEKLDAAIAVGAAGWAENTALMDEAGKFYASTAQQLEGLKNKAVNVAGELGAALLPVFNALIDAAAGFLDFVRLVVGGFQKLPEPVQTVIVAFGVALAALGPLLIAAGGLLTAWGALAGVAVVLGTSVGAVAAGLGVIVGVITAVVAAGLLIVQNWDKITAAARVLAGTVSQQFQSFATAATRAWDAVRDAAGDLATRVGSAFTSLANGVRAAFADMAQRLQPLTAGLTVLATSFANLGKAALGVVDALATRIGQFLAPALARIGQLFSTAADAAVAAMRRMGDLVVAALQGLGAAVGSILQGVAEVIGRVLSPALDFVASAFARARDAVVGIVRGMLDLIFLQFARLGDLAAGLASGLDKVTGLFQKMADVIVGHSIVPDMIDGIGGEFDRLDDVMVKAAERAAERTNQAFKNIVNPKALKSLDFNVTLNAESLYANVIAAGSKLAVTQFQLATQTEVLNETASFFGENMEELIASGTALVAEQKLMEQAAARVARQQELLAIVTGQTQIPVKKYIDQTNEMGATIRALNPELIRMTTHVPEAASGVSKAFSAVGTAVTSAGGFLKSSFESLKGGALDLLSNFSPVGLISKVVATAMEKLGPAIKALQPVIEVLANVLAAIALPIIKALFPVLKALGIAFTFVGEVVFRVAQGFLLVIGNVVKTIGKLIDALPFVSGKGIINAGEALLNQADAMGDAARAMQDARDTLKGLQIPDEIPLEGEKTGLDKAFDGFLEGIEKQVDGQDRLITGQEDLTQTVATNNDLAAATITVIKEEAGILTRSFEVQVEIRNGINALLESLNAKNFSPTINVQVGGGDGTEDELIPGTVTGDPNAQFGEEFVRDQRILFGDRRIPF